MEKKHRIGWLMIWMATTLFLTIAWPVFAEDETPDTQTMEEMVVTATRTETPMVETTKSIDVIHASDRDEQQQYFLPELIDNQPGVYLKRNGGIGQFSSISIRGTGSQDVQYQYNGMPLRDAASRRLWEAEKEMLAHVQSAALEIEGDMEEIMGDVDGEFQGSKVEVLAAGDVEKWTMRWKLGEQ
jgi:outer membrane receptor for ferrienterochelin and colicin